MHMIANVISQKTLESICNVTYDSRKNGGVFVCALPKGILMFERSPKTSFPYVNMDDQGKTSALVMIQTIRKNFKGFTRQKSNVLFLCRRCRAGPGIPVRRSIEER